MALPTRELVRCATGSMSRQLQLCARLTSAGEPAPSANLTAVRSLHYTFKRGNINKQPASEAEPEGGKKDVKPSDGEQIRIKFSNPTYVISQRRFMPEYARPMSRKAAQEPLGKGAPSVRHRSGRAGPPLLAELIESQTGIGTLSYKTRTIEAGGETSRRGLKSNAAESDKQLQSKVQASDDKGADTAGIEKSVRLQKARAREHEGYTASHESLREAIAKLATEINQWLNSVMQRSAKAETKTVVPGEKHKGASTALTRKQKSEKERPASKTLPTAGATPAGRVKDAPTQNQVARYSTGKTTPWTPPSSSRGPARGSSLKSWKPRPSQSWSLKTRSPNSRHKDLELQLAVLRGEMARYQNMDEFKDQYERLDSLPKKTQETCFSKVKDVSEADTGNILEIKPSLVENTISSLGASKTKWHDGTHKDDFAGVSTLYKKLKHSNTGVSQLNVSDRGANTSTAAGTAAIITSNVVSGASRHQLTSSPAGFVLNSTKGLTSSSRSSLEKGKGFILLNNKEKAKEAEARSQSKLNQTSSKDQSSFILVEPDNAAPAAHTSRRNIVLTDNSHVEPDNAAWAAHKSRRNIVLTDNAASAAHKIRRNIVLTDNSHVEPDNAASAAHKSRRNIVLTDNAAPAAHKTRRNIVLTDNPHVAQQRGTWHDAPSSKAAAKTNTNIIQVRERRNKVKGEESNTVSGNDVKQKARAAHDVVEILNAKRSGQGWVRQVEQKLAEFQVARKAMLKDQGNEVGQGPRKTRDDGRLINQHTTKKNKKKIGKQLSSTSASKVAQKHVVSRQPGDKTTAYRSKAVGQTEALSAAINNALFESSHLGKVKVQKASNSAESDEVINTAHNPYFLKDLETDHEKQVDDFVSLLKSTTGNTGTLPVFGPLTKEQQNVADSIKSDKSAVEKMSSGCASDKQLREESLPHPYLQRTPAARKSVPELREESLPHPYLQRRPGARKSVPVVDLTPDLKSPPHRKENAWKAREQKNEPQLVVTEEEILKAKKPTNTNSKQEPSTSSVPRGDPDPTEVDVWATLLQRRMDYYRDMARAELEKSKKKKSQPAALSTSKCNANISIKKSKSANTPNDMIDVFKENSVKVRPSDSGSYKDISIISPTDKFQQDLVNQQHDKLIESLKQKSRLKKPANQTSPEAHSNKTSVIEKARDGLGVKSRDINTRSAPSPNVVRYDEREIYYEKPSSDLDPFEHWIQSMEDSKNLKDAQSVDKPGKHRKESTVFIQSPQPSTDKLKTVSAENKDVKGKRYQRLETQPISDIAQQIYQDMRATYAVPLSESGVAKAMAPTREPDMKSQALSESDEIYNKINESMRGKNNASFLSAPSAQPRSKILTQLGLGTVTDSKTGLVDPARMPKLGNHFTSLDGFLAMDAQPVHDNEPTPRRSVSSARTGITSSRILRDTPSGDEVRASLAKEREVARVAARQKLIETYEKNIEKYERGLETYRARLRRARQTMMEADAPQPTKSDNPRRHL